MTNAAEQAAKNFTYHGSNLDNIFATYQELLTHCPVGRSEQYGGFVFLTKSEDIFAAEQDPETFSVTPTMLLPSVGTDQPMIPIDLDPPDHTIYRRVLLPLFTPKNIAHLADDTRAVARRLAENVRDAAAADPDGTADASALFARPMVITVFSRLAGFPEKDWPIFDEWLETILYKRVYDQDAANAAGQEVMDYFENLLTERAGDTSQNDLIGVLLNAEVEGRRLTLDELRSYCYLLFLAGLDTTAWAIRASLWWLAQNPEQAQRLRDDEDLLAPAAEEFLRTMSPVQAMARTCMRDTEVSGTPIEAGERVVLVFGAGNRDPEAFPDADQIIIDREDNRHLSFGGGIHRCLGSNLGRQELTIALAEFLDVIDEFSLAKPEEVWHGIGPLTLKIGAQS